MIYEYLQSIHKWNCGLLFQPVLSSQIDSCHLGFSSETSCIYYLSYQSVVVVVVFLLIFPYFLKLIFIVIREKPFTTSKKNPMAQSMICSFSNIIMIFSVLQSSVVLRSIWAQLKVLEMLYWHSWAGETRLMLFVVVTLLSFFVLWHKFKKWHEESYLSTLLSRNKQRNGWAQRLFYKPFNCCL